MGASGNRAVRVLADAPAALAAAHDGNWSVLVITEKGNCDCAYRYPVRVANGQVRYAGGASVNMAGTVAPDGAVHVSIRLGDTGANGNGHLNSGTGTWNGSGPNASCAAAGWPSDGRFSFGA